MDFRAHTIAELAADVNEGRRTAESLVQAALQNIADHDATLNAFCAVDAERALASASAIDAAIQAGERSIFQGFLDAPNGTLSVLPLYPNSGVLVLPTTTAPAALSLATKTESEDAGASST